MGLEDRRPPSPEEYAVYRSRFSNWGRWGKDDELGTLNFVTPDKRIEAASLVRAGRSISLSRPLDTRAGPANPYPAHHFVAVGDSGGMLDYFGLFIHGVTNTHIDAFCHLATEEGDTYYNGARMGPGHMPAAKTGTIEHWRHGIVTRGVLYDIPRLRGVDYVVPGEPVHGWELADAAAAQGVTPAPGDAVLIRCGADAYFRQTGGQQTFAFPAGVHASAVEFLYETEAALAGGLRELAAQPDAIRSLREQRALVPGAFEEMVRHQGVLQSVGRTALVDVEIGGQHVRRGQRLFLLLQSANRDPREFPDADHFDVHRRIERHVGFGFGPHHCIGIHVARLEGRVLLEELLARVPIWTVDESAALRPPSEFQIGYTRLPIEFRPAH